MGCTLITAIIMDQPHTQGYVHHTTGLNIAKAYIYIHRSVINNLPGLWDYETMGLLILRILNFKLFKFKLLHFKYNLLLSYCKKHRDYGFMRFLRTYYYYDLFDAYLLLSPKYCPYQLCDPSALHVEDRNQVL